MRALERRQQEEGESSGSEEIDEENEAELQRQLKVIKEMAMKDFIAALETIKYSKNIDEFDTNECVICIEPFVEGVPLKRIPTCRHFFHVDCCDQWFKSK